MMIGNGWISPPEQYKAYLSFAYEKGLVERDSAVAKKLEAEQAACLTLLASDKGKDKVDLGTCEAILQGILRETMKKVGTNKWECFNMYDVRLKDSFPSCGMNWPVDLKQVTPYLQRQDVIDALHVSPGKKTGWSECSGAVGSAFASQTSKPSISILPDLLKEVELLLFSGGEDLICNHIGTEEMISNMEWNGGKGFEISSGTWAPRQEWQFEGEAAGFYQEARNLTYVLFNNASHMVPYDYSRRSREMLDKFMKVDIASIGGAPAESVIDGEKAPATSVGGHPNSTAAEEAEKAKVEAAKWSAYYKSGEVALVVVALMAAAWGYYIWRERRHRAGYKGLFGGETPMALAGAGGRTGMGLEGFRNKRTSTDIEAGDFDEAELDEFHVETPAEEGEHRVDRYSVGSSSDAEGSRGEKSKQPEE
jgi:carboxypeptidase D